MHFPDSAVTKNPNSRQKKMRSLPSRTPPFSQYTHETTKEANAPATDTNIPPEADTHEDLDEPADEDDLQLYEIDLYQAADSEANIELDHRDALDEANCDLLHNYAAPDAPSSTYIAEVPMPVILSEIITAKKREYLYQNFFDPMGNAKSLLFEGEDGLMCRRHTSTQIDR